MRDLLIFFNVPYLGHCLKSLLVGFSKVGLVFKVDEIGKKYD